MDRILRLNLICDVRDGIDGHILVVPFTVRSKTKSQNQHLYLDVLRIEK